MRKNKLKDFCKYSFTDLFGAAGEFYDPNSFMNLTLQSRNKKIKELCLKCGWYYFDIQHEDGIFTAFGKSIPCSEDI